jgi:hypothetical protein
MNIPVRARYFELDLYADCFRLLMIVLLTVDVTAVKAKNSLITLLVQRNS